MSKNILSVLLLSFVSTLCNAEDTVRLVQPKATTGNLQVTELKKDESSAKLKGQVWIGGTFIAQWPAGASAANSGPPEYILVPDKASMSKLPYFYLTSPTFKHAYKVTTIDLQNGEDALRLAFSSADVQHFLGRKVDSVRLTGRFFIADYEVGIECDAPWAHAILLNANLPNKIAQIHLKAPERC